MTTTVLACVTTEGSDAFVVEGAAASADDCCESGTADGRLALELDPDASPEPEPELVPGLEFVPVSCTEKVLEPPPEDNISDDEHDTSARRRTIQLPITIALDVTV